MYIIEFAPPMLNVTGLFNTFRLGLRYSKILKVKDIVLLVDRSKLQVIGEAIVEEIHVGRLDYMAEVHAFKNHNQLGKPDAPDLLIEAMMKRYGPHMVSVDKKVTVVYLNRMS